MSACVSQLIPTELKEKNQLKIDRVFAVIDGKEVILSQVIKSLCEFCSIWLAPYLQYFIITSIGR